MADIVPVTQSVYFDGSNIEEVTDLITDPGFALTESSETRLRWQMMGESEPSYITVYAEQWLLYRPSDGGTAPIRGISGADYTKYYREIS